MTTFVDTSGILAIMDADDPNHTRAAETWTRLVTAEGDLLTHNYVVVETAAVLHRRAGVAAVRRLVDDLLPVVRIHWVTPAQHDEAMRALLAGGRRGPGLVDCISFGLIARTGADQVLAFDRLFDEQGYQKAD